MEIQAAVTDGKGAPFAVQSVEVDDLRPDEVLVKVAAAGVCHTDLIVRDQWYPVPLPAVLGHEGAGVVERVGGDVDERRGRRPRRHELRLLRRLPDLHVRPPDYCHDFFARNFGGTRPDGSTALAATGSRCTRTSSASRFATHASPSSATSWSSTTTCRSRSPRRSGAASRPGRRDAQRHAPAGRRELVVFGTGTSGCAIWPRSSPAATTIIGIDLIPARLELAARARGDAHGRRGEEDAG